MSAPQQPDSTPSSPPGRPVEWQFEVKTLGPSGIEPPPNTNRRFGSDDGALAIREFARRALMDQANPRPTGSQVVLSDTKGELSGSIVSQGFGLNVVRFDSPAAGALYDAAIATLVAQQQQAEKTASRAGVRNAVEAVDDLGTRRPASPPLAERFNIEQPSLTRKDYLFRDQMGAVAFSERPLSFETTGINAAAIKGMIDRVAERGWEKVNVVGSPEFRREVWIAGTAQNIKVIGHQPTVGDREAAEKARTLFPRSAAEVSQQALADAATAKPTRQLDHIAIAVEKALQDRGVAPSIRGEVRTVMLREADRRLQNGERFDVKLYDANAPRAVAQTPTHKPVRARDPERAR